MKEKHDQDVQDFLKETSQKQKVQIQKKRLVEQTSKYRYLCPKCRSEVANRKNGCSSCGYRGYIPMNEKEMKKIRWILFVVFSIVFILYVIFR